MKPLERSVREFLSNWQVWVGIAYFGLAAVVVALFVLFNRTAHEEAVRAATARSAAQAQVSQCVASAKNGPLVRGFANGFRALVENQIETTQGALHVAKPHDPLIPVRERSLRRLFRAEGVAEGLVKIVDARTPSMKSCRVLARKLHVPLSH